MAETFLSPPALLPRDVPRLRGVCNALPCEEPWVRPLGGLVPPRLAALYGLVSKEAERELVAPLDGGEATLVPLTPWVGGVKSTSKSVDTTNYTARWFEEHFSAVYPELVRTVRKKLPKSNQIGVVEDHVMTFVARLIERDTLRKVLEIGGKVRYSVLKVWVYQSACTEMRGWGVDASLRATRDARTHREILNPNALPLQSLTPAKRTLPRTRDGAVSRNEGEGDLTDPQALTAEGMIRCQEMFDAAAKAMEKLLPSFVPARDLLLDLADGGDRGEIATKYGLTLRATTDLLDAVRARLPEALQAS